MNIESFDSTSTLIKEFSAFTAALYRGDPFYTESDSLPQGDSARFFLAFDKGKIVGRAAAVINASIAYDSTATGLIGWYEAENDIQAAGAILNAASTYLRQRGCAWVVGPMNGSTWYKYRITIPSHHLPFLFDNYHKPWYFDQFRSHDFTAIAQYYSSKVRLSPMQDERIARFEKVLEKRGITIRQIRVEQFEQEIDKIYQICTESFKRNFLYSLIQLSDFNKLYAKVKPYVDPSFVLIAEDKVGEPVGFIFAIPNFFEKPATTAVIKTVAIVPRPEVQGLGTYLVAQIHKNLLAAGFAAAFHALMHDSNISTKILSDNSEPYHHYVLFGKKL